MIKFNWFKLYALYGFHTAEELDQASGMAC
jgi:hypothetical protein